MLDAKCNLEFAANTKCTWLGLWFRLSKQTAKAGSTEMADIMVMKS
jgi:hypothetical protein